MIEFCNSFFRSLRLHKFWIAYALQDIKNKYTRSFIGPFWVTISMAVMVFAMGPLYGALFNQGSREYTLYLATGIVFWSFISTCISESCEVYASNRSFIVQSNFPILVYINRLLFRNLILLSHNMLIPLLLVLTLGKINYSLLLLPVVIGLTTLTLFPVCLITSLASTRFRDLTPMIQNIVQLLMFLTPVFWVLGDNRHSLIYIKFNPFYYMIDSFRFCFGISNSREHLFIIFAIGLSLIPLAILFYIKARKKVVYWI